VTIRIFVAYDVEHDQDLCDRIQTSPETLGVFEVSGSSRSGAMTEPWERRTADEIGTADQFVVACGEHTGGSEKVAAELRMALEKEKPIILLWARREAMCKMPASARPGDTMFSWTPEILRDQLVANQRKAHPAKVPDRLVRPKPAAPATESSEPQDGRA
jgi:hypothetical protein